MMAPDEQELELSDEWLTRAIGQVLDLGGEVLVAGGRNHAAAHAFLYSYSRLADAGEDASTLYTVVFAAADAARGDKRPGDAARLYAECFRLALDNDLVAERVVHSGSNAMVASYEVNNLEFSINIALRLEEYLEQMLEESDSLPEEWAPVMRNIARLKRLRQEGTTNQDDSER